MMNILSKVSAWRDELERAQANATHDEADKRHRDWRIGSIVSVFAWLVAALAHAPVVVLVAIFVLMAVTSVREAFWDGWLAREYRDVLDKKNKESKEGETES